MMILDPAKLVLSSLVSVLILAIGGLVIASNNPTPGLVLKPLASVDTTAYTVLDDDTRSINTSTTENSSDSYKQNSQEYANIDVETVAVSIESSTQSNSDDWSLENISDQTLEINR